MNNDDDQRRNLIRAVLDTAYRPRNRRTEEESEPANMTDADRRRELLRRMLRDALNPVQPEPTWAKHFPTRGGITAETLEAFHNDDD